ncbi:LGFP repeat-containing protein [Naasia sp. SYSU D00057]|uniref:LGFP repeat-containing protein n=1 Tax=Naasia sp. SYSU D00057 TaxID=2817380 RepID=UPI001B313D48|nr:hypothetical protein [Naasia sp. SYSU D00057]
MPRILTAALAALAVVASTFVGLTISTTVDAEPAQAANLSLFDPGDIIADEIFWDAGTMSADQIQSFLQSKMPSCASGYVCLKDYRETTRTIAATPMCRQYTGAPNESAAWIIYKVAQACGVNPQVILVMLQKEQGLVGDSSPSSRQYRSAMGAGCPDTADCDSNYYGYFNQVHYGAYLLKRYTMPAGTGKGTSYSTNYGAMYPVGTTSNILYNPNSACGTKSVYIRNQATHSLYVYTPYTPNDAALRAGYGTGDGCSAYGNRNFYNYFTDWFGSTHPFPVVGEIANRWNALGALNSYLGWARGPQVCGLVDGGCFQEFRGGYILWSPATGAWDITPGNQKYWGARGYENGSFGYPTSGTNCGTKDGGCWQSFEGGWIISSASTGMRSLTNDFRGAWAAVGFENGALGYPKADMGCGGIDSGCWQEFQGGWVISSTSTGAKAITNAFRDVWKANGFEGGWLGYPTSATTMNLKNGGGWQSFQGGYLISSPAGGIRAVRPDVRAAWGKLGYEAGTLGYPTSDLNCTLVDGGCAQRFEGGYVVVSAEGGAQAVPSAIRTAWGAQGYENGWMGYPTSAYACSLRDGGCYQSFEGGYILSSKAGGIRALTAEVRAAWGKVGFENGWLGYPKSDLSCVLRDGGCVQEFEGGYILVSKAGGAQAISSTFRTRWGAAGYENGALGYPITPTTLGLRHGGGWQQFEGGYIIGAPGVGYHVMQSTIRTGWATVGFEGGVLGYPVGSTFCSLRNGGCYQQFEGGYVIYSPATGAQPLRTAVRNKWGTVGFENGRLGYPTSGETRVDASTTRQNFERGHMLIRSNGVIDVYYS